MRLTNKKLSKRVSVISAAIIFALTAGYGSQAIASKALFKHFVNSSKNDGYWSGYGTIHTTSGEKEKLKCKATYFLDDNGVDLKQNLRCASESYSIKARSKYHTDGKSITGNWIEETFEIKGNVTGNAKGNKMQLSVRGQHVNAEMSIVVKKCSQNIEIHPKDAPIKLISMTFGRC